MQEQLPAKGKWGVLLPLLKDQSGIWQGNAKDKNGNPDTFYYHSEQGLMSSKEYNLQEGQDQ